MVPSGGFYGPGGPYNPDYIIPWVNPSLPHLFIFICPVSYQVFQGDNQQGYHIPSMDMTLTKGWVATQRRQTEGAAGSQEGGRKQNMREEPVATLACGKPLPVATPPCGKP